MKRPLKFTGRLARLAFILLLAALILWGILFLSFDYLLRAAHDALRCRPAPAADYASALARFQEMQELEGSEVSLACDSILLTHGQRAERAVVLFHGYTNCPQQFRELGQILYDLEDLVLITSKSDEAVSDFLAWQLIGLWRSKGLFKFAVVDFGKAMEIDYDMIDPAHNNQQTEIVYPVIAGLLNAQ